MKQQQWDGSFSFLFYIFPHISNHLCDLEASFMKSVKRRNSYPHWSESQGQNPERSHGKDLLYMVTCIHMYTYLWLFMTMIYNISYTHSGTLYLLFPKRAPSNFVKGFKPVLATMRCDYDHSHASKCRLRWADFGCSLRGGVVIAERSGQFGEAWSWHFFSHLDLGMAAIWALFEHGPIGELPGSIIKAYRFLIFTIKHLDSWFHICSPWNADSLRKSQLYQFDFW